MFCSLEKRLNKKRVGLDVYYYHKDIYTFPPGLSSTEPYRRLSAGPGRDAGYLHVF